MKPTARVIFGVIIFLAGTVSGEVDKRISQLTFALDVEASEIRLRGDESRAKLFDQYATAAGRLQEGFQKSGDFENAIKAREEAELAKTERKTGESGFEGIDPLRATMTKSLGVIAKKEAAEIATLSEKYVILLKGLQKELTKEGKLDAAVTVDKTIQGLRNGELKPDRPESETLVSVGSGRRTLDTLYTGFPSLTANFPIGFDLSRDDSVDIQLERANRILVEKADDALARWNITVESVEDSVMYGHKSVIKGMPEKIQIGGRVFDCHPLFYYSDVPVFDTRRKGNTVEIFGRIAHCRLILNDRGTLLFKVAHAVPTADPLPSVPAIPEVTIVAAKWGPKAVGEIIEDKVLERHEPVWASNGSMKGDPAPGWKKSLNVRFKLNGVEKNISRFEGGSLKFEDFFK